LIDPFDQAAAASGGAGSVGPMRIGRSLLAVALVAVAAGCGKSKPLAASARPCLAKLGKYVHHTPQPRIGVDKRPILPVPDPDQPPNPNGFGVQSLVWPDDFQEYGEISYPPTNPGANDVQVLIFGGDALPKRIQHVQSIGVPGGTLTTPIPGQRMYRIGQSLVMWSSMPTTKQRAAVDGCLE
jgi:hypothetical protein